MLVTETNVTHAGIYHLDDKPWADKDNLVGKDVYSPIVADDVIALPYAVGKRLFV